MTDQLSIIKIFNIILITGVIYGFTFNAFLFFNKKRKGKPLVFLNLLVLFISLNNLQAWLIDMHITSNFVYIKFLKIPWYLLCMPMFDSFLINYTKLQKKVHLLLAITMVLFL
ncbi:MAG: hypothetical protein ACWA42_00730, partial [Lutibacter sp.]